MALTTKEYYVYNLIDPRNNSVFYVGKGTGNRAYQHEMAVRRNRDRYSRTEKEKLIGCIVDSGFSVGIVITNTYDNEADALYEEEMQIMSFGIENLTNQVRKGCPTKSERDDSYKAGRFYADAMCKIPDSRVRTNIGDNFGITGASIHNELDEIMPMVKMSKFVKGISDAIEKRFSGAFAPIGGFYG